MKILTLAICLILFAMPLMAQVNVSLSWDASVTQGTLNNPIQYYLYQCSDAALTICQKNDAGQNLGFGPISLQHATTIWFYATARNYALEVDGTVNTSILQESDKSNVLQVKAFSPPGNPKNNRIQVTQIGESRSGTDLYAKISK